MIRPAYRYDALYLDGTTAPPIQDPVAGSDPWVGITEQTPVDADGHAITSIYIMTVAKENDAVIRFSRDGITWGADIVIFSDDNPVTHYIKVQKFQIRNETAGSDAIVQVVTAG